METDLTRDKRTQFLQQHINRSLKRYARMTGRAEPSARELEANLHKRLWLPEPGAVGSRVGPQKRYNRHGALHAQDNGAPNKFKAGKGRGAKAGAAAAAAAGAGAGAAAAAATSDNGGPGFSEVNLKAALAGGLTTAGQPTADNSLGLDIESVLAFILC